MSERKTDMRKDTHRDIDLSKIVLPPLKPEYRQPPASKSKVPQPWIKVIQNADFYWSMDKCHGLPEAVTWLKHNWHNTGRTEQYAPIQLAADFLGHKTQYLTFGTYERFTSGVYEAIFCVSYWWGAYANAAWNEEIALLDITTDLGQKVIAQTSICPRDIIAPTKPQWFSVKTDPQSKTLNDFEARVFWRGKDSFAHFETRVFHWV